MMGSTSIIGLGVAETAVCPEAVVDWAVGDAGGATAEVAPGADAADDARPNMADIILPKILIVALLG